MSGAVRGLDTCETGTPASATIENATVVQGGAEGLQVLVAYEEVGGKHAAAREVQWMLEGLDADFTRPLPLETGGNALGPFVEAQVVRVRTGVSSSSATRTSAVRTITIEESPETTAMAYDPSYPATGIKLKSAEMRAQLQGLKEIIDAVPVGPEGPGGPPG